MLGIGSEKTSLKLVFIHQCPVAEFVLNILLAMDLIQNGMRFGRESFVSMTPLSFILIRLNICKNYQIIIVIIITYIIIILGAMMIERFNALTIEIKC